MSKSLSIYIAVLLSIMTIASVIHIGSILSVEEAESAAWEYAYFDEIGRPGGPRSSFQWRTAEFAVSDKTAWGLFYKLGGTASDRRRPRLKLLNLFGEDGWEYVDRQRSNKMVSTLWRRPK